MKRNNHMKLTPVEAKILNNLADAYISFCRLSVQHPNDNEEMVAAIHLAQRIIMSRVAVRGHPELFRQSIIYKNKAVIGYKEKA